MSVKKIVILFFFCLPFIFETQYQAAAGEINGIDLIPQIIDEKAKEKDIIRYTLTLANHRKVMAVFYPVIFDISETGGKVAYDSIHDLDITQSLTRWIKIARGEIKIMPGETQEIPLEINIASRAVPQKYFAAIVFAEGANRYEAEKRAVSENFPKLNINLQLDDNLVEGAQIENFSSRDIFLQAPLELELEIKNTGNVPISPAGIVMISDRRGAEVAVIDIAEGVFPIDAGEVGSYHLSSDDFFIPGKYKARLELSYGEKNKRDLQDVTYFWILPRAYLIFDGSVILLIVSFLVYLIFRSSRKISTRPGLISKNIPVVKHDDIINLKD
jgi:hypothetical protein